MLETLMRARRNDDIMRLWANKMADNGLRCGACAAENMLSLMTGEYYDCGSAGKRFKDCILLEEVNGGYHISEVLSDALSNNDFKSEL